MTIDEQTPEPPLPPSLAITDDIVDALQRYSAERQLRATAPNPDLRAGPVWITSTIAIDLGEIVAEGGSDRRVLQQLRANDKMSSALHQALVHQSVGGSPTDASIRERMDESFAKNGKRLWTNDFLDRYAPIELKLRDTIRHSDRYVDRGNRIEPSDEQSPLHFVRYQEAHLQMFRDGTLCYTLRSELEYHPHGSDASEPATVAEVISRLEALEGVARKNFGEELLRFVRDQHISERLEKHLRIDGEDTGVRLYPLHTEQLGERVRRAKSHTLIFIKRFYDGERIEQERAIDPDFKAWQNDSVVVPLHRVLASSSLAGILNSATWYEHYNSRYVAKLTSKEIGYRDDELYLTDRKATVVCSEGFWNSTDSLYEYRRDVVLAVEHNVALLAYLASTLSYYQNHPDIRRIERIDPAEAMQNVVNGRATLSYIEESLELSHLIDHGFTRLFVERLRQELGFNTALQFIRQRLADASTSVNLRSSVDAAEHTSRDSLAVARESNIMQRRAVLAAIAGAVIAAAVFLGGLVFAGDKQVTIRPGQQFCVATSGSRAIVQACPPKRSRNSDASSITGRTTP